MIKEILGCLDMVYNDACNKDNMKLLHAHKDMFVSTVESELDDVDKITVYSYAQDICQQILDNKKYNRELRKTIHRWCGKLEIRKKQLEQKGYYALLQANLKAKNAIEDMIRLDNKETDKERLREILKQLDEFK